MVSLISYGALGGGKKYEVKVMFLDGLSSESKPTGIFHGMPIPNGSEFTEIDTGIKYLYDAINIMWHEQPHGGGGGGGGSDNYNDLSNKPQIGGVTLSGNKSLAALGIASTSDVSGKADAGDVYTKTEVDTALAGKADAGDIPTVNDSTITIQKNGTTVDSFTTNTVSAKTINITVPTSASDISALPASTKYAGASTAGGAATSAAKLNTNAGSATQPVYFSGGVPVAGTYSLNKTVPADAVFTDTTYENKTAASGGNDVSLVTTGEKYTWNNKVDKVQGKGLSTNDYTTADKQSLADIASLNVWRAVDLVDMWKVGGLNYSGQTMNATNRARTTGFIDTSGKCKVSVGEGHKLKLAYYTDTKETTFVGFTDWLTADTELTTPLARYCKLLAGLSTDADVNLTDINTNIKFKRYCSDDSANSFRGLVVSVIGDSISTNGNTDTTIPNAAEIEVKSADVGQQLSAYVTYYDVSGGLSLGGTTYTSSDIGKEVTFTPAAGDVGKVIGLPNNYNVGRTKVWWEVMADELGCTVNPVCWSGASVTSHEANTDTLKCSYAWHPSQIRKCGIRTAGTMDRTAPDVIILYRGTNDFSHQPYTVLTDDYFDSADFTYPTLDDGSTWTTVSCTWEKGGLTTQGGVKDDQNNRIRTTSISVNGVYKLTIPSGFKCRLAYYSAQQTAVANFLGFSDWFTSDTIIAVESQKYARLLLGYTDDRNISADDVATVGANITFSSTSELTYGFKQGLVLTISKLREAYPNTKIFLCTLNTFKRVNYSHFPTNNGINTLPQYNNAIREVADYMGCGVIEFDKDGITFENIYSSGYASDSATTPTHPSEKGHRVMGLKAIADLKAQYSQMG